jgi:hypothetical protein
MINSKQQNTDIGPFSIKPQSYDHGISPVILLSIRKKMCSLSLIVIMTDI